MTPAVNSITLVSTSKFHPLPLALASMRLWEPNELFSLSASFGIAANMRDQTSGGSTAEYLLGPTFGFFRTFLITPGVHFGSEASIAAPYTLNGTVPSTVASVPIQTQLQTGVWVGHYFHRSEVTQERIYMAPKKIVGNKTAIDSPQKPLCANAPRPVAQVHPTVAADPMRASAIMMTQTKWVNGTVLHYCFFTSGPYTVPPAQADVVRNAFATWKAVGIGLDFIEVQNLADAEVRIAYSEAEGLSQSQVGRDILSVSVTEPTTQYGGDLTSPYGRGTALHELGHVLGLMHEHQSPFAGIVWNDDAVYASLEAAPNSWSASKIYENILLKLTPQQVDGSTWDPDSIMEYEFRRG